MRNELNIPGDKPVEQAVNAEKELKEEELNEVAGGCIILPKNLNARKCPKCLVPVSTGTCPRCGHQF